MNDLTESIALCKPGKQNLIVWKLRLNIRKLENAHLSLTLYLIW